MHSPVFDTDALFRLLVAQVEDYAIFALDPSGQVQTWNPGAQRFKGYTADEIIGRNFSVFYPPESLETGLPERLLKTALTEGHAEDEGWRVRKDGSRFWASVVITALHDESGRHVGFAKITRDLTDRRTAEQRARELAVEEAARAASQSLAEELEATNEQLQATLADAEDARDRLAVAEQFSRGILESIADPFIVVDSEWRYRFVNVPAAEMMEPSRGISRAGLIGRSMWELYPDIKGTSFELHMRRAAEERRPISFEAFYGRRGEWSLLHCYPLPDGGLAVQWRDITARKRAEEANHYLARASEILNRTLDYETTLTDLARVVVPDLADWCGVDIVDDRGVLRQLAVAHADPTKTAWARELNTRYPPDPDAPTGVYNVLRTRKAELYPDIPDELLVAGARDEEHLRISRDLGLKSAMIVPLAVGQTAYGVLSLVSAESGRRYNDRDLQLAMELAHRAAMAIQNARLHRVARDAQRAAEEANRAKSDFLATMSHELRTPLNAIAGYVDLLRLGIKGPLTPEQQDYLMRIERSEKYLLSLIQDVLSFAKIEAGRVDFHPEVTSVQHLIDEVSDVMAPQVREAGLVFHVEECTPEVLAFSDRERTRQILLNLLANAVKFTPRGGEIVVSCVSVGETVHMRVRDTGIGIPSDKLHAIFEPFIQLDRHGRGGRAGTGLGLAISRDLAHGMGGDLTVESELGRGSTFTLILPRREGVSTGRSRRTPPRSAEGTR